MYGVQDERYTQYAKLVHYYTREAFANLDKGAIVSAQEMKASSERRMK